MRIRLCPSYNSVSRLPLTSATYAHALDPDWPLCKFEARGACRDPRCAFQMARDYALDAGGVLRSLHALARWCAPHQCSASFPQDVAYAMYVVVVLCCVPSRHTSRHFFFFLGCVGGRGS